MPKQRQMEEVLLISMDVFDGHLKNFLKGRLQKEMKTQMQQLYAQVGIVEINI